MADLKTGAKFIDQDPPLADQETKSVGRKIIDYLAYLKERLNFIFSNYGRRLTDADGHINELTRTAEETISVIYDPETGLVSQIQQNANAISLVVDSENEEIKAASIVSAINDSGSSVIIDADHIALDGYVTFTNLATEGQTAISGGNITTGTISADRIGAGTITSTKLASDVTTSISNAQTTASNAATAASNAATAASNAQTAANGANSQEQLIYISKAAGTTSVAATTTWITDTTGSQNTWTLKRPQYNSSYPVLFVATQRKNVAGTVTCTTPMIDETTTVIDGGRIVTNSITAAKINLSDLFAQNITATNFNITGGSVNVSTNSETYDVITLTYGNYSHKFAPIQDQLIDGSTGKEINVQGSGIFGYATTNNTKARCLYIDADGHAILGGNGKNGSIQINNSANNNTVYLSGENTRIDVGRVFIYGSASTATYGQHIRIQDDSSAIIRALLSKGELVFRDASGAVISAFPPTSLNAGGTFSATTAYKYSGYSVTVPANRYFSMTIHAYYSAVAPVSVCASTSSTSLASGAMQFEYNVDSQNTRARGSFTGKNTAQTTYYIWAKAASAGTLGIGVDGYYF